MDWKKELLGACCFDQAVFFEWNVVFVSIVLICLRKGRMLFLKLYHMARECLSRQSQLFISKLLSVLKCLPAVANRIGIFDFETLIYCLTHHMIIITFLRYNYRSAMEYRYFPSRNHREQILPNRNAITKRFQSIGGIVRNYNCLFAADKNERFDE